MPSTVGLFIKDPIKREFAKKRRDTCKYWNRHARACKIYLTNVCVRCLKYINKYGSHELDIVRKEKKTKEEKQQYLKNYYKNNKETILKNAKKRHLRKVLKNMLTNKQIINMTSDELEARIKLREKELILLKEEVNRRINNVT